MKAFHWNIPSTGLWTFTSSSRTSASFPAPARISSRTFSTSPPPRRANPSSRTQGVPQEAGNSGPQIEHPLYSDGSADHQLPGLWTFISSSRTLGSLPGWELELKEYLKKLGTVDHKSNPMDWWESQPVFHKLQNCLQP